MSHDLSTIMSTVKENGVCGDIWGIGDANACVVHAIC